MSNTLEKLGRKVLKKCSECGIYPSFSYGMGIGARDIYIYMCPKCQKANRREDRYKSLLEWNIDNGFDELDENTWHDDSYKIGFDEAKVTQKEFKVGERIICYQGGHKVTGVIKVINANEKLFHIQYDEEYQHAMRNFGGRVHIKQCRKIKTNQLKIGDRVEVTRGIGLKFHGEITSIKDGNNYFVKKDGYSYPHDESPFYLSECKKINLSIEFKSLIKLLNQRFDNIESHICCVWNKVK